MEFQGVVKIEIRELEGEIETFPSEDGAWAMTITGSVRLTLVMGDGTRADVVTGPSDTTHVDVHGQDVKITQA